MKHFNASDCVIVALSGSFTKKCLYANEANLTDP